MTLKALRPIRNQRAPMQYRRFGKTEQELSVITLGGMRYVHGWEQPSEVVPQDMIDQCARVTKAALDTGINHIETAHGYGKSEHCYGIVLNDVLKIPRSSYHLMTKGTADDADGMKALVDKQLKALKTDRIDSYGWHGINTSEIQKDACKKGGSVEALLDLKRQGVIGAVGFSTHGPQEVIIDAIATDLFDFVNLHYYYFFQRHIGAVTYAAAKDMGVFIISPNDKGGQLFNAPQSLKAAVAPLTPIQWNARFCLSTPHVHTLSFGLSELAHVEEMKGVFPVVVPMSAADQKIHADLDVRILRDPTCAYDGYNMQGDPSGINIPEVLRFRRMWKCHDMHDFGVYRYNMLQSKGHWFPGCFADEAALAKVDVSKAPPGLDIKAMLRETHQAFYKAPKTEA